MPRSAGVYTLPIPPFVDGAVISAADNNTNNTDIANALTGSVPRDGTGAMQAALPMGGYKITGMANATAATDAAAYGQLAEVLISRTVITGTPTTVDLTLPSGFTSFRVCCSFPFAPAMTAARRIPARRPAMRRRIRSRATR
jgi:hypothetical protein